MSDAIRLAAVGVAAAVCAVVLKKQTPELGLALVLMAGAVILGFALSSLRQVTDFMDELAEFAGLSPAVLAPVMKVVGIAVVSRTAGEVCRDAGEGGLSVFVETAAAALALAVTVPMLRAVLDMLAGLMQGGGGG